MKTLTFRDFLIFALSLSLSTGTSEAGYLMTSISPGMSFIQPRKAKKVQKKQDDKEMKRKKAIKDGSRDAQKRSFEIQSPEVQARMKQNKKDTVARDKARKKIHKAGTKRGAKKYG